MSEENSAPVESSAEPVSQAEEVRTAISDIFTEESKRPESVDADPGVDILNTVEETGNAQQETTQKVSEPKSAFYDPDAPDTESGPPDTSTDTPTETEAVETVADAGEINFYVGDEAYALTDDAEIELQVDGEMVRMKLSEFRNDLSGQAAISKRFTALDQARKQVEAEGTKINQMRAETIELAENGRAVDAMAKVCEHLNVSSEIFMHSLFQELQEPLQNYLQMTPQQQAQWEQEVKALRLQKQYESVQNQNAQLQAKEAQLLQMRQVQSKYSLSDADFVTHYDQLISEINNGEIQYDLNNITPETVGNYYMLRQQDGWIQSALEEYAPQHAKDTKVKHHILQQLTEAVREGHKIDQAAVQTIISGVYGVDQHVKVAEEVSKTLEARRHPHAKKLQPKSASKAGTPKASAESQSKHWLQRLNEDLSSTDDPTSILDQWKKRAGRA